MIPGLVRYVAADVGRSQRWVPPVVVFLTGLAMFNVSGGPLLTTYADTSAVLLPVAVWLTVAVLNSEDQMQAGITAVTVGGETRLRLGKLVTAATGCAVLAGAALLWPVAAHSYGGRLAGRDVAAGAAAHLLVGLFGVALGSWGMRAVLPRPGWVVLFATAACLADVLVPHAPPTRRVLELFDEGRAGGLAAPLGMVGVETLALGSVLVAGSLAVARRRA